MRRINISKGDTRVTSSFYNKDEFVSFLSNHKDSKTFYIYGLYNIANDVWNLKVAEPYSLNGYTFSIQSKARVGNQLVI